MAIGDFMDDSNRSHFYKRLINYLEDHPLSMCGLIGDRIYLCPIGTTSEILSNFSHNCCLELCMNFGLPLGILLNIFFLSKLIKSIKLSFRSQYTINYIFMLHIGGRFFRYDGFCFIHGFVYTMVIVWISF